MKRQTKIVRHSGIAPKIIAYLLTGLLPVTTVPEIGLALPHGGIVSKGSATLRYAPGKLQINQTTNTASYNWSSYNVKAGQTVLYSVPWASSTSLNFIGGMTPSRILGTVKSNGILYFMNPNGLIFGSGSVVNAAGVMAYGASQPWGTPTGSVTNAGSLSVLNGGTIGLIGTNVTNLGSIKAPGGNVLLASGSTVEPIAPATGSSSLSVVTTGSGMIDDSGIISAKTIASQPGHIVLKSGSQAGTIVLSSTGVLDASAPNGGNGGTIETSGHRVNVADGALVTTAASEGMSGTWILDPASFYIGMNTGTANGTKGNVLNYEDISGSTLGALLGNGNIVIDSTSGAKGTQGNIYVNDPIVWNNADSLTLNAVKNIEINSSITNSVSGYSNTQTMIAPGWSISYPNSSLLVLRADDMDIGGTANNTSGGGAPSGTGTVSINSGGSLNVNGPISIFYNPTNYTIHTSYTNAGTGIPTAYMLISSNSDLYYIDQNQTSQILPNNYALNTNLTLPTYGNSGNSTADNSQITVSSTTNGFSSPSISTYSNWVRLGGFQSGGFNGNFDGLNHSISNLVIYDSSHISSGFFGYAINGVIENLGINSGNIYASNTSVNYYHGGYGGFTGISGSNSILIDDFSKVSVTGSGFAGGFVGQLCPTAKCGGTQPGVVFDSHSTGSVSDTGGLSYANSGGFVGNNEGAIFSSYETGSMSGQSTVGGFVGIQSGSGYPSLIDDSYATGNVSGNTFVGGFAGYDRGGSTILNSYSTGTVTGSGYVGGFIGANNTFGGFGSTIITNSYWNTTTSGRSASAAGTGLNSSQFKLTSGYSNWGFNAWGTNFWQSSSQTNPWFMTSNGPALIPDMLVESVIGKGGSSVYSGLQITPGFTASITLGATPVTSGISSSSLGPNVGTYLNTPVLSSFPSPTAQSGIGDYSTSSGIYSITPYTLTATAHTASMTYGDSVPALSGSLSSSAPDLTVSSWNTTATSSSNVGGYAINPTFSYAGGAVAGDYSVTQAGGNTTALKVTQANLSATGSQVYNGSTSFAGSGLTVTGVNGQTFAASGSGTLGSSGNIQSNQSLSSVSGLSLTGNGGALTSNYNPLTTGQTSVSVTPLSVTATANTASMTYGGSVPALSGTLTSAPNLSATWATPATSSSDVGGYAINPTFSYSSGAISGDYAVTLPSANNTALSINPALLSFSSSSGVTKTYDGTTAATLTTSNTTATLSGFVNGQGATFTGVSGSYSQANAGSNLTVTATANTGDFSSSGTGFSWGNYSLPSLAISGVGSITPLSVTATANTASMTYGGSVPALSGSLSSSAPNLAVSSWGTTATSSSNVGSDAITPIFSYSNGAGPGDYAITLPSANNTALDISKATVDLTGPTLSTSYGTIPALKGTISSPTLSNTALASLILTTWGTMANSTSPAGQYATYHGPVSYLNGSTSNDFNIVSIPGTLTINPSTLNPNLTNGPSTISPIVPVMQTIQTVPFVPFGSLLNANEPFSLSENFMELINPGTMSQNRTQTPFNPLTLSESRTSSVIVLSPTLFVEDIDITTNP